MSLNPAYSSCYSQGRTRIPAGVYPTGIGYISSNLNTFVSVFVHSYLGVHTNPSSQRPASKPYGYDIDLPTTLLHPGASWSASPDTTLPRPSPRAHGPRAGARQPREQERGRRRNDPVRIWSLTAAAGQTLHMLTGHSSLVVSASLELLPTQRGLNYNEFGTTHDAPCQPHHGYCAPGLLIAILLVFCDHLHVYT